MSETGSLEDELDEEDELSEEELDEELLSEEEVAASLEEEVSLEDELTSLEEELPPVEEEVVPPQETRANKRPRERGSKVFFMVTPAANGAFIPAKAGYSNKKRGMCSPS